MAIILIEQVQCSGNSVMVEGPGSSTLQVGTMGDSSPGDKLGVTFDQILTAARADAQYLDFLHIISIKFPKRCNEVEPAHLWECWEVRKLFVSF